MSVLDRVCKTMLSAVAFHLDEQIVDEIQRANQGCKVGKRYCKPGTVCKPIEGSFCTECEDCENFN